MPIHFRTDLPAADQYWQLYETTGWNRDRRITPEGLAQALAKSWYCVCAYDGDRLVGSGRVVGDDVVHAMIYDVIVAPEYQRQGIGTQIVERLLQRCLDARIHTIQLFCAAGKQAFYEKLGFVARPSDAPGMQYRG